MRDLTKTWGPAAGFGMALTAMLLIGAGLRSGAGGQELAGMAVRWIHVFSAFIWGGFIIFVNLVQLVVIGELNESERPVLLRRVLPRVAKLFTAAAHATLLTGLFLLVPLHKTLGQRPVLLLAVAGGLSMWAIVQFVLRPNVCRVTGRIPASAEEIAVARGNVTLWARVNLLLVLPVSAGMVAAAHWGA